MAHPNLENEDPIRYKTTTKEDEIKELENKTEKHGHEDWLKPLKNDNE